MWRLAPAGDPMLKFPPMLARSVETGGEPFNPPVQAGDETMFDLVHGSHRSCDGVSRRNFLRIGSLSALGLTLPAFLKAKAAGASVSGSGKDVSCILLW